MMPEFTYEGMVRYAFGFYNPNHAAALLCVVLPFLLWWMYKARSWQGKIVPGLLTVVLTVMLAMTYSRTGIIVAVLEAAAFIYWTKQSRWNGKTLLICQGSMAALGGILWLSGALGRFTIDRALLNRGDIWLAACDLAGANPWGVGEGRSGMLASTFILPEGIACRTMVNSHLTLLAEYGMLMGGVWLVFIGYALTAGWRRNRAVWISFAGLTVSAWLASVFDWHVLFDVTDYGGLALSNWILSWLLLLIYLGMGVYLSWGRPALNKSGAVILTVLFLLGTVYVAFGTNAPVIYQGFVIKDGKESNAVPLVLYDSSWDLGDAAWFMNRHMPEKGYRLPLEHMQFADNPPSFPSEHVVLHGECAHFMDWYADANITLISPPEYIPISPNITELYLKRHVDRISKKRLKNLPNTCVVVYD